MPFFLQGRPLNSHIGRYANLGEFLGRDCACHSAKSAYIVQRNGHTLSKSDLSCSVIFIGGISTSFLPQQLILLLLPVLPILVSNYVPQWKFQVQYSATTLPFLFFCSVYGLHRLYPLLDRLFTRWGPLSFTSTAQVVCLGFIMLINYNLYYSPSYIKNGPKLMWKQYLISLKEIPRTSSVCATSNIIPHLINRQHVVMFGTLNSGALDLRNADYLLIDTQSSGWPLSKEEFPQVVAELYQSKAYILFKEHDGVVLLKRKSDD